MANSSATRVRKDQSRAALTQLKLTVKGPTNLRVVPTLLNKSQRYLAYLTCAFHEQYTFPLVPKPLTKSWKARANNCRVLATCHCRMVVTLQSEQEKLWIQQQSIEWAFDLSNGAKCEKTVPISFTDLFQALRMYQQCRKNNQSKANLLCKLATDFHL